MAAPEEFDFELIAAYIDGKLSRAERDRAVKLLGESEAAFEIYADAVRTRADLDIVPIPKPWWRNPAVPAAAAAAILLAVTPMLQVGRVVSGLDLPALAVLEPLKGQPGVATALGIQLDSPSWSVTRGGNSMGVDSTTALRLGVRAADLQAVLALGDRERGARVAAEIFSLVRPLSLSDGSAAEYETIRTRLVRGDSIGGVSAAADSAEKNLEALLASRWFGYGKWFGAGELAALAHSASFFSDSHTTKFLDSAIKRGRLAPEDVDLLRQVAGIAKRGVADAEFATVREKFAELIRRHGG